MDRFVPEDQDRIKEVRAILRHMYEFDFEKTPASLWRYLYENTPRLTGGVDYYAEQKSIDNRNMLAKYDDFYAEVKAHPKPFHAAVRLAICGNIIDYTPAHGMDMDAVVKNAINSELAIDHVDEMLRALKEANHVLYLTDNAGEIVVDKLLIALFIEEGILKPEQITVAVRKSPTLNDATMEDAVEVGLTDLVKVIDNGDGVPGTELDHCSPAFREHYENADIIISKGMGNFESLHSAKGKAIFFLLVNKCSNVARVLGLPLQSFVCMANYL
jgi:hypothetical protein